MVVIAMVKLDIREGTDSGIITLQMICIGVAPILSAASIIFGFTGTPIQDVNIKKDSTTTTIFGSEIHRYTLADGIRDKNVLGFDPYKVSIYDDDDLRTEVALHKAKADTIEEAMADKKKQKIFLKQ